MTEKDDAIALKDKGNEAFKKHDWPTAISFYTQAIELYDKEASFYTNRAQVRRKQGARDRARLPGLTESSTGEHPT